jgi:hypothetical protein
MLSLEVVGSSDSLSTAFSCDLIVKRLTESVLAGDSGRQLRLGGGGGDGRKTPRRSLYAAGLTIM